MKGIGAIVHNVLVTTEGLTYNFICMETKNFLLLQ